MAKGYQFVVRLFCDEPGCRVIATGVSNVSEGKARKMAEAMIHNHKIITHGLGSIKDVVDPLKDWE